MRIPTITVYKGSKKMIVNKSEVDYWRKEGWKTSSDRQKASKEKDK